MSFSGKVSEHPVLSLIVFALLGIMSLFTLSGIPIGLMPEMTMPVLMVSTSYDSAGPESVEKSVTSPLETSLSGVSGLNAITSTSSEESSMIRLEFDYGTDLESASNDVRDKLDRVKGSLPDEAGTPTIMKFDSTMMPVMKIAVRGDRSPEDLKEIAENYLEDRLLQASGVGNVSVSGGREKIVRVEISQNRLDAYELTMTSVASALATQNLELGGGKIGEGSKNYIIRTVGEFSDIDEINDTIVAERNGYVVRLRDVGRAFEGYGDVSSYAYVNGESGVYVSITKQSSANTVDVADAVYAKLEEIRGILPAGISLDVISDDSEQVRNTVNSLVESALQGAILAMLVLMLFLRNLKSTLIMGISIPFSILITLLAMKFAGITMNMMTMTGLILGVGMVVDSSVVVLENIHQYRERGTKASVAAVLGTQEVLSSVVAGNLTTVCVFIPIILFQSELGMIGQMIPDLIFTIIFALVSSLFVAMFLVPVLAGKFLPPATREEKPLTNPVLKAADESIEKILSKLGLWYGRAVSHLLSRRKATAIVVAGLLAVSLALTTKLNLVLMPNMRDEGITLNVSLPIGTKLEETDAVLRSFETIVREETKGWESIVTSVGSGGGFSSGNASYKGSLSVQLPDADEQIDSADDITAKLRSHFDEYPSVTFSFSAGMMRQMTGSDIDIALRTDDLDIGLAAARSIASLMKEKIPEVSEASIDLTEGLPQVEVVIDRDRAYSFGVNVASVANEINASVQGITATVYRSEGKEYSVTLVLEDEDRSSIPDLDRIFVQGTSGRIAVANFARLEKGVGPVSINRENQQRVIHITADILSDSRADQVEEAIKQAIDETLILPESVSLSWEGSWKSVRETGSVFLVIFVMAILLVYGVMVGTYESFRDPFINLFTIPLGIIGVVAIYILTGQNLSMFTAFGFVMLVGIAVNNGIILVDQTNLLASRGVPMRQAIVDAAVSRLRPILMTTLTTLLGMFPLAFFPSANGQMMQPIGLAVFGGLASATLITLFFIPVLYSIVNNRAFKAGVQEASHAQA